LTERGTPDNLSGIYSSALPRQTFNPIREGIVLSFDALCRTSVLAGILLLLTAPTAFAANLEPTGLQDAHLLEKGTAEFRLGFSYADRLRTPFQKDDRDRRVAEVPSLALNLGLGERVEGQLYYDYLYLKENGQKAEWGSGDLVVAFNVGLIRERPVLPALALRIATKLPNADQGRDFGTDQTDFYVNLLSTKDWQRVSLYINLGFGILGNPNGGQDDLMQYGIGLKVPLSGKKTLFLISAEGNAFGRDYNYNNRGAVLAGIRQPLGRVTLDFGGSVGYVSESEDWGLRAGLTLPFSLPAYR
jgi:hypothetical protein